MGKTLAKEGRFPRAQQISVEHALWLQTTSRGMSRTGYQEYRRSLKDHNVSHPPGWNATKDYRDQVDISRLKFVGQLLKLFSFIQNIVPEIEFFEENGEVIAAKFDLFDCVSNHAQVSILFVHSAFTD